MSTDRSRSRTDLVTKLRGGISGPHLLDDWGVDDLMAQAADEIELLQAELGAYRTAHPPQQVPWRLT